MKAFDPMNAFDPTSMAQSVYDLWVQLVPQLLGDAAGAPAGRDGDATAGREPTAALDRLLFPMDQFAKVASSTQQMLQSVAQSVAPMLQGAMTDLSALALPLGDAARVTNAANAATQAMFAPWNAFIAQFGGNEGTPAWQGLHQSLADFAKGSNVAQITTAFDRTYGAFGDALGLGPARRLHAAWQDMLAAGLAQQDARMRYALLVQGALAQGSQRLVSRLAAKADAGERVDSALALLRLWAGCTEECVHETLQSQPGLDATAALTRSALAYRKRVQNVASVVADLLDMATRRDLDEAYAEIQALKRELRKLRPPRGPAPASPTSAVPGARSRVARKSKRAKGTTR